MSRVKAGSGAKKGDGGAARTPEEYVAPGTSSKDPGRLMLRCVQAKKGLDVVEALRFPSREARDAAVEEVLAAGGTGLPCPDCGQLAEVVFEDEGGISLRCWRGECEPWVAAATSPGHPHRLLALCVLKEEGMVVSDVFAYPSQELRDACVADFAAKGFQVVRCPEPGCECIAEVELPAEGAQGCVLTAGPRDSGLGGAERPSRPVCRRGGGVRRPRRQRRR